MANTWNFSIWNEDKEDLEIKNASDKVEDFYDFLRDSKKSNILVNGVKLTYRDKQHKFSRDIMRAIRDKQILLIQAGVGIGKSMGYLIPIFYTYDNSKKFENIVISTSSIGLQQQLLTDINNISNMLGIDIKVAIAKGVGNYLCYNRLMNAMINPSEKEKYFLTELEKDIKKKLSADRDDLIEVGDEIWKKVQLTNRGFCSRCSYSRNCFYRPNEKKVSKASIIITNHGHLAKSVMDNRDFVQNADMFVFDEAHKLEDSIRNIDSGNLLLNDISDELYYYLNNNIFVDNNRKLLLDTIKCINNLFERVKKRGEGYYYHNVVNNNKVDITNCEKIPFSFQLLTNELDIIIRKLNRVINIIKENDYNIRYNYKLDFLYKIRNLFMDMRKVSNSKNIYWIDFIERNTISIGYAGKSISSVTSELFNRDLPIICTSGTLLDANGSYEYFKKGLSLDVVIQDNREVIDGKIYPSPYDYDNHTLFYYDKQIPDPKRSYEKYLKILPTKVSELIRITNGRSLVLFTSKKDMDFVYSKLCEEEFEYDLLKQGQATNYQLIDSFKRNVKSCLFATGAFWEGVDISGKSLSNVIIARLPFDNVNAITESRNKSLNNNYVNDMIQKLAQGTGRLVRKKNDKGIICCLDSRFERYKNAVIKSMPFTNFSTDINQVIDFSNKYIVNRDGIRGPYKKKIR